MYFVRVQRKGVSSSNVISTTLPGINSSISGETGSTVRTEAGLYGLQRYPRVAVTTFCTVA